MQRGAAALTAHALLLKSICAVALRSDGSSAHDEVQNQGNYREDQKQVDQTACHVKHRETTNPCDQQNHEQDCPDTHFSLLPRSFTPVQLRR
jgi:hypothetical protein